MRTGWTLIYRFDAKILMEQIKIMSNFMTILILMPVLKSPFVESKMAEVRNFSCLVCR